MADDYRGRFLWDELMTTDPRGAAAFYTRLLQWETQAVDAGTRPYTIFTSDGQPLAGLIELPEEARKNGARPHWMPFVGTPNTDATVEQAGRLGAKTFVPPLDLPGIGRAAVLADPAGATFALFTPSSPPSPEHDVQPSEFSWHELMTTADPEAAFGFYSALFGWTRISATDMGGGKGVYLIYGRGDRQLGGMFKKGPDMPAPAQWTSYVRVHDVKSKAEELEALGGHVANGPMEVPGGDWIVQFMDPQGAPFALHALARKS